MQVQDARHVPLSDSDKLRQDARQAAEVRALHTNPDVVALRVERVRSQVDGLMWAGLLLGLAFTMVNVQTFAAAGAALWSLGWFAAWLLDPMVSLVLVAVLRAEQVTARYQVPMQTEEIGPWVRRTKAFAFLATYTMNTWQSWAGLHVAGIVLHSVPPVAVYLIAETGPILRDRLTEAVTRAARPVNAPHTVAQSHAAPFTTDTPPVPANVPVNATAGDAVPVHETGTAATGERRPTRSRKPAKKTAPRRVPLAENLAAARTAHRPGVVVTPAWVREVVPDISRGSSQKVSDALNTELAAPTTDLHVSTRKAA
jgi:hypothetical protein